MEEILVLGGAVLIAILGIPVYLLVVLGKLKKRVALLEREIFSRDIGKKPAPQPEKTSAVKAPAAGLKTPLESAPALPNDKPASAWSPAPKVKHPRKSFVFSGAKLGQLGKWAQDNWVFILAGVSLALAGVFLVQYGVEKGLLTPTMRVMSAIGFGGLLIGFGEFIRRRSHGDKAGNYALLPSVFAGAGLVAIFAGVLSARMLYGLIESNPAFVGLGLTGALAILLGWVYGPLLATLGVFGALAAPFLVGGGTDSAGPLHLYFALIAAVALTIDAYRRWAWLSALALIGAFAASLKLSNALDTGFYAIMFAFVTALLATGLPVLAVTPRHAGPRLTSFLTKNLKSASPAFPTRVAGGAYISASLYIGWAYLGDTSLFWLVLMVLLLLVLAAVFWMKEAPALADIAFIPPLIALFVVAVEPMEHGLVAQSWLNDVGREVLDYPSPVVAYLLAGSIAVSLAFAWRSYFLDPLKIANAAMAAGFAPWMAIVIEILWAPGFVLGAGLWALYLAVIAALMLGLTERFARIESDNRMRTAVFALSTMSMISFMLVVVLGDLALTLSLAVMVLAAAWLGQRFRLGLLDYYIQIGAVLVSYRLVFDPGLDWAFDAPLWQVLLGFLGVIGLLAVALLVKRTGRAAVIVVLESAVWTLAGILASLLLMRWLDAVGSEAQLYVVTSFAGLVWLMLSANQLYRLKVGGRLRVLRIVLASFYGLASVFFFAVAVVLNPAFLSEFKAVGWPIFGSLGAAYLLPALVFGGLAKGLSHLHRRLRIVFITCSAGFAALFVALEIRHFWHGGNMARDVVLKPELYTYTVAMILVSIGLLALAFLRQSPKLRKLALVMVALVMLKVFFVDMSGLDGLLRVASFLALGLVAALMAWVNRMLKANEDKADEMAAVERGAG